MAVAAESTGHDDDVGAVHLAERRLHLLGSARSRDDAAAGADRDDAGLRDAGRYLSRCRPTTPTYTSSCSTATAKLIAFYGTQGPADGAALRVRGWGPDLADITVIPVDADGTITVQTAHLYETSPLFAWLGVDEITINSSHEERYMGW